MSGERPKKPAGWYSKEQRAARAAATATARATAAAERAAAEAKAPGAELRAQAARLALAARNLRDQHAVSPVPQFEQRMARLARAAKRERQRIDHLVFEKPRPAPVLVRPPGLTRREWKRMREDLMKRGMILEPGIEEAVQRRETYSRGQGTPETNEKSNHHSDSLLQLEKNGTIDKEQKEYAAEIANVYRSIESDVALAIASMEARVDNGSGNRARLVAERIGRVRLHLAYTIWRELLPDPKQAVLDMIVGDAVGYTVVARRYGMHARKAKRRLIAAIDVWPLCRDRAFDVVSKDVYDKLITGDPVDLPTEWRLPLRPPEPPIASPPVYIGETDDEPAERVPLPPVDARYLDDQGHMRPWAEIADIIREGLDVGEQAA